MEIYAIRHAQSTYNKWSFKRIYTPWLWTVSDPMIYDAPLSPAGIEQANELKLSLNELSEKIELVICSPLSRAIHTMQIALPDIKCPVIITPLIRERCDKTCDIGIPLSQLRERYTEYEFLHFNSEHWWHCDQSAPFELLKETPESLRNRQRELIEFLKTRSEKVVVMVTHGQFIKKLIGRRLQIKNCGVKKLSLDEL